MSGGLHCSVSSVLESEPRSSVSPPPSAQIEGGRPSNRSSKSRAFSAKRVHGGSEAWQNDLDSIRYNRVCSDSGALARAGMLQQMSYHLLTFGNFVYHQACHGQERKGKIVCLKYVSMHKEESVCANIEA